MGYPGAQGPERAMPGNVRLGLWRLADPKITLASMASMFLGTAAALRDGSINKAWLALTVLGVFLVEVAKNASGEVVDFDSGDDQAVAPEDRSPFSGGKRVMVDGLLTRGQTLAVAAAAYAAAAGVGLAIALGRDRRVLWLGLVGMGCAFSYHASPLRLSYRGLGEAAVALCYGPLIASGTYLVQRGDLSPELVLVSLPLGTLIAAFLWINEFPDYKADRAAGKNTLVVRLGRRRASHGFALLVAGAYAGLAVLPLLGVARSVWLGFAGLPPAVAAARRLMRQPERTAALIPAQAWTLASFLLFAAGSGLGLLAW
jgi:1,4-dihydroxy-2-naphthoate polyprenyltransferase